MPKNDRVIADYDLPDNARVWMSTHPVLKHKLAKLRDQKTDCHVFRQVLREVTFYLGYEATEDLETKSKKIETTAGGTWDAAELSTRVSLVPILRSGLGMVDAMLELIPTANVHHIGMYRSKNAILPVQYYNRLPRECDCDTAIILEPCIATAATINATVTVLKTWGVRKIKIITVVASHNGLKQLLKVHPEVDVVTAAIDKELSESGEIIPGLGDTGDRQFGTFAPFPTPSAPESRKRLRE